MRHRKYTYYIYTTIISLIVSMSSCTIESSDNGKFDGFWHLEEVDTLATGGVTDYSNRHIFWGVQHKLVLIKDYDAESFYCRFQQTSDSLILSSPYLSHGHQDNGEDGGDMPMDAVSGNLSNCGINHLEERFYKERLTGSDMTLRNKELRLKFKKF